VKRALCSLAVAMLCVAAHASRALGTGSAPVVWKGVRYTLETLPPEMPHSAKEVIVRWADWTAENGCRLDLDPTGRVLLVSQSAASNYTRLLGLIASANNFTDEHLPSPHKTDVAAGGAGGQPKRVGGGVPEDPEAPPVGGTGSLDELLRVKTTVWGAGSGPLDRDTIVMFSIKNEAQYGKLLDELAVMSPYLAPWAKGARNLQGFALEQPLAGAVVLDMPGQKEWNPDNEFVHRAAELMLIRRFGRQPYWLQQGWAWHVELSVRHNIYCFPYRQGFVAVGEHGGWDKSVRSFYADTDPPKVASIADVASLKRGSWDDRAAKHAWGTLAFLDRYNRTALIPLLADFHDDWDRNSRKDLGGGKWERNTSYEVALDTQNKMLLDHAGANFFGELTAFFVQGSGYSPKPASESGH
jgi:hypothetical protein